MIGLPAQNARMGAANLVAHITRMSRELGVPQSLGDAGVTRADYQKNKAHILKNAAKDVTALTNPRPIDEAAVEQIVKGIEKFKN